MKLFQRQCWRNFCETGRSTYGLFLEVNWKWCCMFIHHNVGIERNAHIIVAISYPECTSDQKQVLHIHTVIHTHTHTPWYTHTLKRQIVNTHMQVQQFLWNQMTAQSISQDCPCTILRLLNKKIYGSSKPLNFVLFLECLHNMYSLLLKTLFFKYIIIITCIYKMPYLSRVIAVYNY